MCVKWSSNLSLPWFSCSRVVFLCLHPFIVCLLFTATSLLVVDFLQKKFNLQFAFLSLATWHQIHCSVPACVCTLTLSRSMVVIFINFNINVLLLIESTVQLIGK